LDLLSPPTALVYAVDRAAFGAYDVARRRGRTIGQDLSLIAYDGVPEGSFVHPQLSTYKVDSRKAGARLAKLLLQRARGADPADLRELDAASFLGRGSHGPAPN